MPQTGLHTNDIAFIVQRFDAQLPNIVKAITGDENAVRGFAAVCMVQAIGDLNMHCRRTLNEVAGDFDPADYGTTGWPPEGPRLTPVVLEAVWIGAKYYALSALAARASVKAIQQGDVDRARLDWDIKLGYLAANATILDGAIAYCAPATAGEPKQAFTTGEQYRAAGQANLGGML